MFDSNACVKYALAQLGKEVLWGAKGPDHWDCSGLVNKAREAGGDPNRSLTYSSSALFDASKPYADVQPGDFAFFGYPLVNHVVLVVSPGGLDPLNCAAIVSADGATSKNTDPLRIPPTSRVNLHSCVGAMGRGFFRGFRRIV